MTNASRAFLLTAVTATSTACLDLEDDLSQTSLAVQLPQYTVVNSTVSSSSAEASTGATCPKGTRVLGGSYAATDASGAYLHSALPMVSAPTINNAWFVQARNKASRRGAWNLRVSAICAAEPLDYHRFTGGTGYTTDSVKQGSVTCPAGSRITGVGFVLGDQTGGFVSGEATYSMPSWDGTSWLVNAKSSATVPWALRMQAICVDASIPGYEVVTNESAYDATSTKQLITACPGTKAMTGAGWGVVDDTYAILDGIAPTHEVDYAGQTWLTNATNRSAFSPSWRLQQRVLCVD